MLINDTTLLRLAPDLFIEAAALATTLLSGTDGVVAATTFTSAGSDFAAAAIDLGHVIVIDGKPVEVDSRTSGTELEVSRPRVEDADARIAPDAGSTLGFSVITFERQIAEAQAWVLGALGIDPNHPETALDETAIVDAAEAERLIALRAIADSYDLAAARSPADDALAQQAAHWRAAEAAQRHRTIVYLDIDGDGVPDAARRIDVVTFTRR